MIDCVGVLLVVAATLLMLVRLQLRQHAVPLVLRRCLQHDRPPRLHVRGLLARGSQGRAAAVNPAAHLPQLLARRHDGRHIQPVVAQRQLQAVPNPLLSAEPGRVRAQVGRLSTTFSAGHHRHLPVQWLAY